VAFRFTQAAEDQLDRILLDSARLHGIEAADRYSLLIMAAVVRLSHEPDLIGSKQLPRLPGIRAYPIRLSRMATDRANRVRAPRHLIIYRLAAGGVVEVLGLAHDRMVLSRAARKAIDDAR
jgi:toxin ParE1/3/4